MSEQKLILLYGSAGIGKSTLAERYIQDNPLSMNLEADRLVTMLGQWANHEPAAWELVFDLSKVMVGTCIQQGHDVIVPHMPRNREYLAGFEHTAREVGARFVEISLTSDRDDAIDRLVRRGTWGEAGAPPITDSDRPVIGELYDGMEAALATRPNLIEVPSVENDYDGTYARFLEAVGQA